MLTPISNSFSKYRNLGKAKKTIVIIIAILIVILLGYYFTHRNKTSYQFITVTKGSVTDTVSVTGTTTPIQSVSLAFQNSGTISNVYSDVGQQVTAGAVLATLDESDLEAQLKQAQASVDAANATLEGLKAGAQPEDIAASQAALDGANQTLANTYASISDTSADSYAKASDAVDIQLLNMFSNPQSTDPQITFQTNNSAAASAASVKLVAATAALAAWQTELSSISASSSPSDLTTLLSDNLTALSLVSDLLNSVSVALNGSSTTDSTIGEYKTQVSAGQTEVNAATKNLNTTSQNIASQKLAVAQAQAELALKQAGSTSQDIDAQQAQVEEAQASVESVQAKMANSEIVAPLSGVITQFDAKVGEAATPGTPLISIISNGAFEIDADVPETDIGKIAVKDPVVLTFDAFPGETFNGTIFYIDPAETINQGVVDYKIKVSFAKADPRMKSGLTADLSIQTAHKDNVLTLPQYAILQNDQGTFVETLSGKTVTNVPVVVGIQDQTGTAEIISGVTEGEQVLNVGLKQGS